ncbi:hypothetical protein ACIHDR_49280 [Nocardia sp. NPDC052278]|uniref:hypothetical protein n=1 Tax=unclassified Nocardia TaxID=2637762 RepID=UPI0036C6389C
MSILYEYFAAADDAAAAAAVRCDAPSLGMPSLGLVTGLDPAVHMAILESLLRRIDYEQVIDQPRWCDPVTVRLELERPAFVTIRTPRPVVPDHFRTAHFTPVPRCLAHGNP